MNRYSESGERTVTSPRPTITMNVSISGQFHRLPVYLLLDCSGSMRGAPIEAVQRGVETFLQEARQDQHAYETVHVGLITFSDEARMLTNGLVSIDSVLPPVLKAEGKTCLGAALRLLQKSLDTHVRKPVVGGGLADYKPLIFILTDGEPTDKEVWPAARQEMLHRLQSKGMSVVTVGCGAGIKEENLKQIAMGTYFKIDDSDKSFQTFFDWVTQSVVSYSTTVTLTGGEEPVEVFRPINSGHAYVR